MKDLKSMVELTQIAKCSLRIVWTLLSARRCVSRAHKQVRTLRTKDGARVSIILARKGIFMFSCAVSMHLEYRICIYLLIVV